MKIFKASCYSWEAVVICDRSEIHRVVESRSGYEYWPQDVEVRDLGTADFATEEELVVFNRLQP